MKSLNLQRDIRKATRKKDQAEALFGKTKLMSDYNEFCKAHDEYEILLAIEKELDKEIIHLVPEEATKRWENIEICPITMRGEKLADGRVNTFCQRADKPSEIYFYSVYVRRVNGEAHCIADVPTYDMARTFANMLRHLILNYVGDSLQNMQEDF